MTFEQTTQQDAIRTQTIDAPARASIVTNTEYLLSQPSEGTGNRPRVVIVGAGFGGLTTAQRLGNRDVDVLLIDRNNYHGFWPLLYQVATSSLEAESIAYPVRGVARRYRNIQFLMGEVQRVDFDHRQVILADDRAVGYDYLVLAAGSANNYFGNNALAAGTYGLKDLDDALELRNSMLAAVERAANVADPEERQALLTFVIVGGGPTGVELAGAFSELVSNVLRKDYPMLDMRQVRVMLIEANKALLGTFPARLQRNALRQLERRGVEVRLGTAVASVERDIVTLKDGTQFPAHTVIWAAGVRSAELSDRLGLEQARNARVKVTPTLNLEDRPEVFVIGDMAYLEGFHGDKPYPMVAPAAMQMGKAAAKNILAQLRGKPPTPFSYFDKGQMATIGRRSAVFDSFGVQMSGWFAWVGWLLVHLVMLIGFRNRLIVLFNWAYNYFTYDRAVRLIIDRKLR